MTKFLTIIFLCIISLSVKSQPKGIKYTYVATMSIKPGFLEIENEMVKQIMLERLRNDKKVYSLIVADNKYLFQKDVVESIDKMPLEVDVKTIYIDFNDSTQIVQSTYGDNLYLVNGPLKKYHWILSSDSKEISGKTCYKAILKNDPTITAWFTPDIPLGYAPLGYYGLPGLVVSMETPIYTLNLKEITDVRDFKFIIPNEGKSILEKDFERLINKNAKKIMDEAESIKEYK